MDSLGKAIRTSQLRKLGKALREEKQLRRVGVELLIQRRENNLDLWSGLPLSTIGVSNSGCNQKKADT